MDLNPSRLEFARRRRGLTQTALAEAVGVTPRSIKAFEAGDKSPSEETLDMLAQAVNFPTSFLLQPDAIETIDVDAVSFRSLKSLTARKRDGGLAAASLAAELNRWLEARFDMPPPTLPPPEEFDGMDPEVAAEAVRRKWGLGEAPIGNMIKLLETKGVRVFSLVEDCHELDAFSTWLDGTPFVFLNTGKTAERSRMDCAHELGHLLLHRTGRPQGKDAEDEATRFASAFLMPRASLLAARLPTMTLPPLIGYKTTWGVALSALVHRLHRLGRLTEWQYRSLFVELSSKGFRTAEPNEMPREKSHVLQTVLGMLREDGIGRTQIARELNIPASELDRLVFGLCMIGVPGAGSAAKSKRSSQRSSGEHLRLVE
jgi:Zn-dependent peptidase ImmA (M78 family)/DNA-binding XRE family transcriptional regulator